MSTPSNRRQAAAPSPGETIRALRKRLDLTLSDVSDRTGLSVSTLSKLEQGKASLSYDKLLTISHGLGVDMAQVLEPAATAMNAPGRSVGRRAVIRKGEWHEVETRSYRQLYLATELLNKRTTPLIAEVRARTLDEFVAEFGGFIHHPGEEFSFVLEGQIEFHTEFYAPVTLSAGDSIYFDSDMGHAYLAVGEGPCRVLAVCANVGNDTSMIDHFVEKSAAHLTAAAVDAKAPPVSAAAKRRKRAGAKRRV